MGERTNWYALSVEDTLERLDVDGASGLTPDRAAARLAEYGRNEVATEPPPTFWQLRFKQWRQARRDRSDESVI